MKNSIGIIGLLLILILSACDKEDSGPVYSNNQGLLYQVKFDEELYYEYSYNNLNQIAEEKSKLHYTRHHYQNGKLISSDYYIDPGMFSSSSLVLDSLMNRKEWVNSTNTELSSTKTYSHDTDGKIIKYENHLGISEYSYDDKFRISRQTFYRDNEASGYVEYLYNDNDNLIKRMHYWILAGGSPVLQTTTEYEFDDKNNPYKSFSSLTIPGRFTNSNNIIKETYTIYNQPGPYIDNVQITENTYRYNSQGFPVSKNNSVTYFYY